LANDVDSKSDQQRLPETTPAEQPVSSATFVRVDISAQAVRDKVFEDLLVRNGLSLRPMMFAASSLGQELNMQQAGMAANSHLPAGRAQTLPSQTTARGASNLQQQQSAPRSSAATSMTYECEINAAQLDFIVKQIKENSTAFSQVRLELLPRGETQTQVAGDPAERGASRSGLKLNEANRAASESLYATNGASRSDQKPGDAANQRPLAEQQVAESSVGGLGQGGQAKSQATPDTAQQAQDGRADPPKQRVVFVLNVVERPYADAARQAPPAAAAPAKAEVKSKE
jgi:hypothetical protein